MATVAKSTMEDALAVLTAAVAEHQAGGEVRMRLQPDWCDGAVMPTITVRVGNRVTVKQAGTYHEAARSLLAWVGRLAVDDSHERRLDS